MFGYTQNRKHHLLLHLDHTKWHWIVSGWKNMYAFAPSKSQICQILGLNFNLKSRALAILCFLQCFRLVCLFLFTIVLQSQIYHKEGMKCIYLLWWAVMLERFLYLFSIHYNTLDLKDFYRFIEIYCLERKKLSAYWSWAIFRWREKSVHVCRNN